MDKTGEVASFKRIGSLMKEASATLKSEGLPPSRSLTSRPTSRTTGRSDLDEIRRGLTGIDVGKAGFADKLNSDLIDRALEVWLPPSVTSAERHDWRDGPNGYEVTGYSLEGEIPKDDAAAGLKILRELNKPAGLERCSKELARLKVLMRSPSQADDDTRLQMRAMAEELAVYPIDVVSSACRHISRHKQFFPSWSELRMLCEERVLKRRGLLRALERYWKAM